MRNSPSPTTTPATSIANRFVLPRTQVGTSGWGPGSASRSVPSVMRGSSPSHRVGQDPAAAYERSSPVVGSIGRPRRTSFSRIQAMGIGRNQTYSRKRNTPAVICAS